MTQVATRHSLHINSFKIVTGFDIHALEGEGDAFSQKKTKGVPACRNPLVDSSQLNDVPKALTRENNEAPTLMHEGGAF
jgi:hypothetical protein